LDEVDEVEFGSAAVGGCHLSVLSSGDDPLAFFLVDPGDGSVPLIFQG
jgi:hypothetical protein